MQKDRTTRVVEKPVFLGLLLLDWLLKASRFNVICIFSIQMVFYLVLCIIGLILAVIQVIIALFGWLIWHVIRKVVEENCDMVGDTCHCSGKQDVSIKRKEISFVR